MFATGPWRSNIIFQHESRAFGPQKDELTLSAICRHNLKVSPSEKVMPVAPRLNDKVGLAHVKYVGQANGVPPTVIMAEEGFTPLPKSERPTLIVGVAPT